MGVKAEIIDKKTILIKLKTDSDLNEPTLEVEYHDKCRFFKGTNSIKQDGWTYYCKGEEFYCNSRYCLIINIKRKEEALNKFKESIKEDLNKNIYHRKIEIEKNKRYIEQFKEVTNKTLKMCDDIKFK